MENLKLSDNVASTSAAAAQKTEPMVGMPSMLSSQQPGKDASRAGEEDETWSPSSSPNKPAAGKTQVQSAFSDVTEKVAICWSNLICLKFYKLFIW